MPQIPTLPDKRKKKGNRRSNPSHAIATFHPRSNRSVPETVFPFSIRTHTRAQKKRRCEKKGIRDKVSQEANDNDTQPP